MSDLLTAVVRAAVQDLEPAALEVQALRGEVAEGEETLTDCLTSLGQEEAKVCEAVRGCSRHQCCGCTAALLQRLVLSWCTAGHAWLLCRHIMLHLCRWPLTWLAACAAGRAPGAAAGGEG